MGRRREQETLREARRADRVNSRLAQLQAAIDALQEQQNRVEKLARELRRDDVAWSTIAGILGVSRQAAQQRFGKVR